MESDDRVGAEMYDVASVLAALGHELRLKVWFMLVPYGSRGLSAGSVAAQLAVPPSTLLFHLQRMTKQASSGGVIQAIRPSMELTGTSWTDRATSSQADRCGGPPLTISRLRRSPGRKSPARNGISSARR